MPVLKKYGELLSKTCVLCQEIIRNTASSIPVLFAAKILSISRFFIPAVAATINDALLEAFPPSPLITIDLRRDIYLPPNATSKFIGKREAEKPILRARSMVDLASSAIPQHALSMDSYSINSIDEWSEDDSGAKTPSLSKSREMVMDFSHDTILPSSVTPSPSPGPLFKPSGFSPIPGDSPSLAEVEGDGSDMEGQVELKQMQVTVAKPPLAVKDYAESIDRSCLRSIKEEKTRNLHDDVVSTFPSLFFWDECVGVTVPERLEAKEWWKERWTKISRLIRRLQICDGFLFDLIRSWFDYIVLYQKYAHIASPSSPFFAFDLFPFYYLQLHALLPSLHHSILQQYSCGLARREGQPNPTEYIKSGLKARWWLCGVVMGSVYLLDAPSWTTQLLEMVFAHCNVFVVGDINTCKFVGPPSPLTLCRLQVPRHLDGGSAQPAAAVPANADSRPDRTGFAAIQGELRVQQRRGDFANDVRAWESVVVLNHRMGDRRGGGGVPVVQPYNARRTQRTAQPTIRGESRCAAPLRHR